MRRIARVFGGAVALLLGLAVMSCGGGDNVSGGSSSGGNTPVAPASNVVSVTVNSGPGNDTVNTLYTTVTVCVPGSTTQCQTIDNIQVDTQSDGLRLLAPVLSIDLPVTTAADGSTLVECTQFVDGYSWGPIATADVQIAGESASGIPVQVIGSSSFAAVPAACSGTAVAEDTVATFHANGILGIGVFEKDCGDCASNANSGFYYACTQTTCSEVAVALANQVTNPVISFATDNNGTLIVLPAVAAPGAATLTGSLIFGIDTQSNNASGNQTVLALNSDGTFTTTFDGQTMNTSIIDSGSNGLYFNSSIMPCTDQGFTDFYCPPSTVNLSATLTGENNVSGTVNFSVDNAETIAQEDPSFTVLPTLAGPFPSTASTETFDWGLPFFYGRRVANAIETHSTAVGTGPYVAF